MTFEPRPVSYPVQPANLSRNWEASSSDPQRFLEYLETNITPDMLLDDRLAQANLASILAQRFYRGSRTTPTFNIRSGESAPRDQETDFGLIHNPAPKIALRYEAENGGWQGSTYIHEAFKLQEPRKNQHYYFFRTGSPRDKVPPYLRPSDIVPSGTYRQAFSSEARRKMRDEEGIDDVAFEWLRYNCNPVLARYQLFVDIPFNKPLERVSIRGGDAERFNYVKGEWEPSGGTYNPDFKLRVAAHLKKVLGLKLHPSNRPALQAKN